MTDNKPSRCTYITPNDFELDSDSSNIGEEIPESMQGTKGAQPPVSLVFNCTIAPPDLDSSGGLDYSGELNLDAFSPTISLLTLPAQFNPDPLVYLEQANLELEKSMDTYKSDFCKKAMVGNYIAAYSQGVIHSNFDIYRLAFAWIVENDLVTVEMTSIEKNIEDSWKKLNDFTNSTQLYQV